MTVLEWLLICDHRQNGLIRPHLLCYVVSGRRDNMKLLNTVSQLVGHLTRC